ncbi:hypothetical protein MACJ_003975 [Theileria orientalis]|uniref:Uncharacterized protein n=1 Tax=Theileria orientalis TaxID=68886 RepID=A0A976SKX6_THEOR|nr:hypothetical protein MACJ_003975 [Theileria orientalis]
MRKIKKILISIIIASLFSSSVLLVVGIALTSDSNLIEVSPERIKKSKIASFVTAGIHLLVSGACVIYTYIDKRKSKSKINT